MKLRTLVIIAIVSLVGLFTLAITVNESLKSSTHNVFHPNW